MARRASFDDRRTLGTRDDMGGWDDDLQPKQRVDIAVQMLSGQRPVVVGHRVRAAGWRSEFLITLFRRERVLTRLDV